LSALFQASITFGNLLLCFALGIPVGFPQLLWIVAAVSVLQSLPISVAGLGVREGAFVYLLRQQGADPASALALSLTVFAIQVLLAAVGGAIELRALLTRDGLS
jgi:uncharacterized membrane protein YbhN (UPF0104 family)